MLGLSKTPYNKLNIHCNGVYGDKKSAMDRFCKNFERLSESVQGRLTVENDDKTIYVLSKRFNVHTRKNWYSYCIRLSPPQVQHRWVIRTRALELAISTWPKGIKPIVHYSESKVHEVMNLLKPQAHSDYINELPNLYGNDVDVMVELKQKNYQYY